MTYQDFDNFRLTLLTASGNLTLKMSQKIANDVRDDDNNTLYRKDFYTIYILNRYIDILLEYNPPLAPAVDTNFFTRDEMLEIQRRINGILNMDWTLDFILTV